MAGRNGDQRAQEVKWLYIMWIPMRSERCNSWQMAQRNAGPSVPRSFRNGIRDGRVRRGKARAHLGGALAS